jgi:hypothetical protein
VAAFADRCLRDVICNGAASPGLLLLLPLLLFLLLLLLLLLHILLLLRLLLLLPPCGHHTRWQRMKQQHRPWLQLQLQQGHDSRAWCRYDA